MKVQDNTPDQSIYNVGDYIQVRGAAHYFFPKKATQITFKYFDDVWHYTDEEWRNEGKFYTAREVKSYALYDANPETINHTGDNIYRIPISIFKEIQDNRDFIEYFRLFSLLMPRYRSYRWEVATHFWLDLDGDQSRFLTEWCSGIEEGEYQSQSPSTWSDVYNFAIEGYSVWRECQVLINAKDSDWYEELKPYLLYLSQDALEIYKQYSTYPKFAKKIQKQIRKRKSTFVFDAYKIGTEKYKRESFLL